MRKLTDDEAAAKAVGLTKAEMWAELYDADRVPTGGGFCDVFERTIYDDEFDCFRLGA